MIEDLTPDQMALLKAGKAFLHKREDGSNRFVIKPGATKVRDGRLQTTRARSAQGGVGWVYLMKCVGSPRCKIGRSVDVDARLKRVHEKGNSIEPYEIKLLWKRRVQNDAVVEAYLHKRYADQRVRGEWFDLADSQIDEITTLSVDALNAIITHDST